MRRREQQRAPSYENYPDYYYEDDDYRYEPPTYIPRKRSPGKEDVSFRIN